MHTYIDPYKIRDYSKNKTIDDVYKDVEEVYKVTNILDDDGESMYYICRTLLEDYEKQRANYEGYIEKGIDARILMELRKSAIIPMGKDLYDFYTSHSSYETVRDIKRFRANYLKFLNNEYFDLNWQYYILIQILLSKEQNEGFIFDFESCFADGDYRKQTSPRDYEEEYRYLHSYEGIKEQIRKGNIIGVYDVEI